MEQELRTISDAQKIDTLILENEKKLVLAPKKMGEMEEEVAGIRSKIETEKQVIEELEKERRKKEKELEAEKDKIKKFESRLYEVKTNKEYQALLKEIETAKQGNDKTEEEIIVLMEKIEELRKDHEAASKLLVEREKEAKTEKARLQKELSSVDRTISDLRKQKEGLLALVSPNVRSTYEVLIERRGGVAVVNVRNGLCLGCFVNIPPQLFIEVMKNSRLILCPSCNRILYYVEEES